MPDCLQQLILFLLALSSPLQTLHIKTKESTIDISQFLRTLGHDCITQRRELKSLP